MINNIQDRIYHIKTKIFTSYPNFFSLKYDSTRCMQQLSHFLCISGELIWKAITIFLSKYSLSYKRE